MAGDRHGHARESVRRPFRPAAAEGATAPESLRHPDRARPYRHSGKRPRTLRRATEGVTAGHRPAGKLSGSVTEGAGRRGRAARPRVAASTRRGTTGMSDLVHNGPTNDHQARGTPLSGDPDGGDDDAPAIELLPLDAWHRARGGRMVPFAGYMMPVQYDGIMAEHLWCRESRRAVRRQPHGPAAAVGRRRRRRAGEADPRRRARRAARASRNTRCCSTRAAASLTT